MGVPFFEVTVFMKIPNVVLGLGDPRACEIKIMFPLRAVTRFFPTGGNDVVI
jgi:hypothetical protein